MIEPRLRFKAFSDELSHHTLMDIIVEKPSNGIMNRQSDKVTAVKHINVIDMYTDDKIHVDELSYSEYGDTAVEKCNVEIGDIFLTRSSVKADGIAKSNILLDDGIYVYDDHLIRLKVDKNNYIPEFVNDYLASPRFRRQFIVRAKTTAFTTIGQSDVASCTGDFPSLAEQQKIAEFLSTIDTVIEKQKETVSAWEERKKGVMQKLFSQEVRFKADDGSEFPEWEGKKISECTKFVKDGTHGTHKNVSNGHPLLSAKDIFDNIVHIPNDSRLISDEDYNKIFSKYDLQDGDVLITIVGTLGRTALVTDTCKHVAFQRSVGIMRPDKSIVDSNYLKAVCDVAHFQNELEIKKNKGAQAGVYLGVLSGIEISVPCLAEQQKIADCLSSFDEVIEKQKATLSAWEELKKGLLQQMFV